LATSCSIIFLLVLNPPVYHLQTRFATLAFFGKYDLIWDGLAFLHRDQLTQTYLFASPFGFPRLPDLQEMSIRVKEEGAGLLSPIERWGDKLRSARAE
jgi:hypothetical protein